MSVNLIQSKKHAANKGKTANRCQWTIFRTPCSYNCNTSNLKVFRHMELTDCFVYDQLILDHPETYLYYEKER